ncbi:hypothetical protein LXL04_021482 [Taraxacum kok-saghyz]
MVLGLGSDSFNSNSNRAFNESIPSSSRVARLVYTPMDIHLVYVQNQINQSGCGWQFERLCESRDALADTGIKGSSIPKTIRNNIEKIGFD